MKDEGCTIRLGIGTSLAAILSYCKWKCIAWALLHGFVSWFYVIYYVCMYGFHIGE